MKTFFARITLGAVFLLAITTGVAWAWPDEPFARIDIRGPGIQGVASITDAELLRPMTIDGFMSFDRNLPQPEGLGEGYELHRYFVNQDGSLWDFDRVMYYPDPAGGPGYVNYLEGIGYGPVWNAGNWFRVTPAGEAAWQAIMTSIAASASATKPASIPATAPGPILIGLTVAAVLALSGILLQLRPKAVVTRSGQ
jgi:hypothetical protein